MPVHRRGHRGFTLIETALAIVVIGVGVLAMLAAQVAFHAQNRWSTHASRAMWLANEIRETMVGLPRHDPVTGHDAAAAAGSAAGQDPDSEPDWGPEGNEFSVGDWDDLDDFDGAEFSGQIGDGPIDASRRVIPGLEEWIQRVEVRNVDPFDINTEKPRYSTDLIRVDVVILHVPPGASAPEELTRLSWLAP